ncbi:hypothetical protein Ddye_010482 [Dipteronia dyeriana]|uniref:Uncharacterized protein n=1 Tax=Dipteronia dyeriana TaxID=168575 RepID=A0AAE0CN71_9ROSI|nr:hypothetical protein Ddye_010482 [Dipteronia dyeriana]
MAIRISFMCVSLVVLILCHEVLYVEGRHLKSASRLCKKCSSSSNHRKHKYSLSVAKGGGAGDHHMSTELRQLERSRKAEYVDDFRPTAPGHSPGVGHSIKN